jgi:hypothetical protein
MGSRYEDLEVVRLLHECFFDPGIAVSADASIIEVGLGRVDSHQGDAILADHGLSGGEQAFEMSVPHVTAVVIARDHQHIRTHQAVEVLPGLAEFLPVPHVGQISGDHHHIGGEIVHLHQGAIEQVRHEVLRARV